MKIIKSENPYKLDYVDCQYENLVALTRKNADFIEAVVGLDSRYGRDRTREIFEKMNSGGNFEACLREAIAEIDRINSTHLEAAENGRETIVQRILSICSNIDDLKKALSEDFSIEKKIIFYIDSQIK